MRHFVKCSTSCERDQEASGVEQPGSGSARQTRGIERSYRELEARLQMVLAADRSAVSRRDPSPHPEPSRAPSSMVLAPPKSSMPAPAEDEAPRNPPSGSIDPPAADARPATPRDEGSATAAARGAEAPPPAAPRDGPTGTIDQTAKAAPGDGARAPTAPVGLRILGAPPSNVEAARGLNDRGHADVRPTPKCVDTPDPGIANRNQCPPDGHRKPFIHDSAPGAGGERRSALLLREGGAQDRRASRVAPAPDCIR